RRSTTGIWTTKPNILGGRGTRAIIMVAEADARVYVLFTRWGVTPNTIEYKVADINTLDFGASTTFISSGADMNNVTGMKQLLPAGSLVAVAEDGSRCLYDSFGSPPPGGIPPPSPPIGLSAALVASAGRVDLSWSAPLTGPPQGYDV